MKKTLKLLSFAALMIGLLGSCSKINERIDGLDKRIYELENDKIASVQQQIDGIKSSISDLQYIRTNIQTLMEAKQGQGEDIAALKAADQILEGNIKNLKDYVDTELAKYATTDWVKATVATLEKQAEIIADVSKLKTDLTGLDEKLDQSIEGLDSSLKSWVNEQLSAYYKKAEMDEKLKSLQNEIEGLKTGGETDKTKISELETKLTKLTRDLEAAKATIKTEYEAAIAKAIRDNNGTITQTIQTKIGQVNATIDVLTGRVDDLESTVGVLTGRIDAAEASIASINQQISAINQSIADLETIRTNIRNLIAAKVAQGQDIAALKVADQTLEGNINNLKDYVDTELAKYATTDWVKATVATLEKQAEIITDVSKLKTDLTGLDEKLDQSIEDLDSSLKSWVNEQLSAYYKKAEMDAKIQELQNQINTLKSDTKTNKTKIAELETSLTQLTQDLATAKNEIKNAYEKAINDAISGNNGYINSTIKNTIDAANANITTLTGRVTDLESDVATLKNDVDALKAMIQTVSIIPAYSNGSLKAVDGILTINCVITPKKAVESLTKDSFTIFTSESEVFTKSALYGTLTIANDEDLVIDETNGTATIKVNISSALPTEEGKALTVALNIKHGISDFTTEFVPVYEISANVNSIADANEALKTKNVVNIESPSDAGTPIVIPAEQNGKDVYITVTGVSEKDISIEDATTGTGAANLNIASDTKKLIINTPQTHVDLYKGDFTTVTATTSATTLVVGKDVKIEHLTINKGNVEIHGKVATLTRATGIKAAMYASDRVTLENYINWAKTGDVAGLECDIDLAGENWTPLRVTDFFAATFDGQGHTISNLKVADYTGNYIGFISVISGATIKNVTFKDAMLTNAVSNEGGRGAVIVGWSYAGVIDNCHVINSSVTGGQKVSGILGCISVEGAAGLNSVTNCSVDGLTLGSNVPNNILYQAGGLVGYIQLINANPDGVLIENNSVKNITINDAFGGPDNTAWYCGTFMGSIIRKQQVDGQKIVLNNNTISGTNTEVFKTIYSSPYFGWATNAENYTGAIAPILIDGQEWTPDYPALIAETGVKYPLDKALAAATAGQTVQILKAGNYTVQTLSTAAAVVEATVDGVVFNRTTAGGWVAAQTDNVKTVRNITWNVLNGGYQYFSNTNLENCTVNGILFTHLTNKFKDCNFINEEGYNFWVYGNEYTEFDNCTFTCPGKNDGVTGCGSALNCYNEAAQTPTPVLVVKNCTFTAKEASNKYSAIYIKPETAFDIRITNSTCNDNFCTGAISGSKLWNLKSDREGTTVSIDGKMVYPF